jgi:hypothetical protein
VVPGAVALLNTHWWVALGPFLALRRLLPLSRPASGRSWPGGPGHLGEHSADPPLVQPLGTQRGGGSQDPSPVLPRLQKRLPVPPRLSLRLGAWVGEAKRDCPLDS